MGDGRVPDAMQGPATLNDLRVARVRDARYWTDIIFGRFLPASFFSIFVAYKLLLLSSALGLAADSKPGGAPDYTAIAAQGLGLVYYCLLATLYVIRMQKRAGDARPAVVLIAFFGSFSILGLGLLPGHRPQPELYVVSQAVILGGLLYTLWALLYLRRSFSILPEARRLITGGPYRLSRHPLYLGEGLAAIGLALPIASAAGWLLIACFLGAQVLRIHFEEAVLSRQFPTEYAEYRSRVPRYFPIPRLPR
jgi:protein-S-isoprenylcysteine O-methyltransferase Ste14